MDLSIFNKLDVKDITLKDTIISLLQDIQDIDDAYMQRLVDLKDRMYTKWHQPWYQKTTSLTRKLKQDEDQPDKFRTDKITTAECKYIDKNWAKFIKKFNVPDQPISLARWRNRGKISKRSSPEEYVRRFVISFLARHLERNLNQVYLYFVAHYGAPNKGPYTSLELKVIAACYYHFPKDAIQYASQILGREARGIHMRIKENIQEAPQHYTRTKWTLESASNLVKLLMEYTNLSLEELKYQKIEKSIWSKLESDFNKSAKTMEKFWWYYLHTQIFVKTDIKIQNLREKIVKLIRAYQPEVWTDIRWKDFLEHLPDGITAGFIYNISVKVAQLYKNYLSAPLDDVLDFVIQKIKQYPNKRLKTLTLNDQGMLEFIHYKK